MTVRRALVLLGIVLAFIASLVRAAPVPFQPYGEKSSADVVLQLANIIDSPWQAELDAILSRPRSEITLVNLPAYEALIDQYQNDEQALALLVPLYWLTSEVSLYSDRRQHFFSRLDSDSGDFIMLLSVDGLLQLHKLSQPFLDDDLHLKEDIRHLYDLSLSQLQQQESSSFLSLWASALLYFYNPGGGLVVADTWLQAQAESTETPEIITLYRKILHELAGQTFPLTTTSCWPLTCAEAMTTDEMARRIERLSNEERRINQIADPEARLQASQNLLDSPLTSFASSHSVQQAKQSNERQLQAIRDRKKKQAAIDQAYQRFQTKYQDLTRQLESHLNNETLWEQLQTLLDSDDARTELKASAREKLLKQACDGLADARESNRIDRTYQAFQDEQTRISKGFNNDPVGTLEALIALVNGDLGGSLTEESRHDLREGYQVQLNRLKTKQQARTQEQARTQSSFERVSRQAKNLLEQIKQSPNNEALLNEHLALLDSPDAQAGFADSYRQKAKTRAVELLSAVRENQRNQRLYREYQGEYDAIMAAYGENLILATEKVLILLNSDKAEPLTPESRKEQKELHQNRLDRLRAQEQAQKERAEIEKSYQTRIQALNHHREQTGDDRAWLSGFIALLDSGAGRYFSETERAERRQQAQALLAEFEPLPETPGDEESLFFSALEAIGREEDPLSQGIERTTENLVRISYEHFPQGTEQVLDALSHIDSAIDAVVEFIDDRTGNTATVIWQQLDETTQARILAGKVLSVQVPVTRVKALAELARTPSPALKKDSWHPDSVEVRHKEWQEH